MARKSRAAAARAVRTPTPEPQLEDEEMQDAPQPDDEPQDDDAQEDQPEDEDEDAQEEEEERQGTPANDSDPDPDSRISTPGRARRSAIPPKRRAGRPSKNPNLDRDTPDDSGAGASDKGTPRKRGGWRGGPRGGGGGGRWGKARGGPAHQSALREDVHNDEVDLPEDGEGETKVDKNGHLLGDREYRVRVFTISGKDERLYMLSTEPARCIGFRDSYLFFQKHPNLYKVLIDEDAKHDLIARDIIPHSYKGRAIGVCTARSVFREFGAKIVIGGRKIVDDYQVAMLREKEDYGLEGELAVPDDQIPTGGRQAYDKNQYVAWHGASSVYHTGQPSVPMLQVGKGPDGKKRKIVVTGDNWMFEHAQAASRYNTLLASERRAAAKGIYDIHTNLMHYPRNTQPTHARWAHVPEPSSLSHSSTTTPPDSTTLFPPLPRTITRNFAVCDIEYLTPAQPDMPYPGPDGDVMDEFDTSLSSVGQDLIDLLDEQQRRDFLQAREAEMGWKRIWGTEAQDGLRGELGISYNT